MSKLQKFINFFKSESGFFIILLIVILTLFICLSPKASSMLFPFKRQAVLNEFIKTVKNNSKIDPKTYWEFREFYSPGYFTFSKPGISFALLQNAKNNINIKYNEKTIDHSFLFFSSQKLYSLDMLTKQSNLNAIFDQKSIKKEDNLAKGKNYIIYKDGERNLKIVFLESGNDMQKANGFFDYLEKDKSLTTGENWFNITSIDMN